MFPISPDSLWACCLAWDLLASLHSPPKPVLSAAVALLTLACNATGYQKDTRTTNYTSTKRTPFSAFPNNNYYQHQPSPLGSTTRNVPLHMPAGMARPGMVSPFALQQIITKAKTFASAVVTFLKQQHHCACPHIHTYIIMHVHQIQTTR